MFVHKKPDWNLPEAAVTPEQVFLNRRQFMKRTIAGAGAAAAGSSALIGGAASAAATATADLYPAKNNPAFAPGAGRAITDWDIASTYNNFYEFGTDKRIWRKAQALKVEPWQVVIDGEVEQPLSIQFDDLVRMMPLEQRIYRLRCVEAWSMVIPWSGFQFSHLMKKVQPTSKARYVRFETFYDPKVAPGQRSPFANFPYVEGITIAEAANELTFMVTGAYGKPAANQFGAPIRVILPWKYGFKSAKSLVRITFQEERPISYWEEQAGREYGFWANVNPEYSHPRWTQASERVVGTSERIPTQIYNGYGSYVASLYESMPQNRTLFF